MKRGGCIRRLYACVSRGADFVNGDFTLRPVPFCKGRIGALSKVICEYLTVVDRYTPKLRKSRGRVRSIGLCVRNIIFFTLSLLSGRLKIKNAHRYVRYPTTMRKNIRLSLVMLKCHSATKLFLLCCRAAKRKVLPMCLYYSIYAKLCQ